MSKLNKYKNIILRLLHQRKPGTTICPSEVLPSELKQDKTEMEIVRLAARQLVSQEQIEITQKGKVINPENIKGPFRLRLIEKNLIYRSRFFDYGLDYKTIDMRSTPGLYKVGKKEQGVLLVEPYKSELLPLWSFKTPEAAEKSASAIYQKFLEYKKAEDFVGMDMARKFLEMGYTRSRRYANHKSGKKYSGKVPASRKGLSGSHGREKMPIDPDLQKAESALIFNYYHAMVENDDAYFFLKIGWRKLFG